MTAKHKLKGIMRIDKETRRTIFSERPASTHGGIRPTMRGAQNHHDVVAQGTSRGQAINSDDREEKYSHIRATTRHRPPAFRVRKAMNGQPI